MKGKGLEEARRLFRARRYPEVIRVLEPDVFRFRENPEYFQLLGFSCLQTGDLGGAFSYVSRALQLEDDDTDTLLGLAAIHFRRAENEAALKRWLEVLDAQPSNAVARRGLDLLRKAPTHDVLQEMIESGKIRMIYPDLHRTRKAARSGPRARTGRSGASQPLIIIGLVVLIIAGLGILGWRLSRPHESARPGVSAIDIPPDLPAFIETGTGYTFILTEKEVRSTFKKARNELLAFHDNRAAVEINRLLLSNAASPVKERARMLKGFITQATFDTLRDGYPYSVVVKQPALYEGCSVDWKGKVANLAIGTDAITFDLLVGYDQERELEGIVRVSLPFAAEMHDGDAVEVLGQVALGNGVMGLLGISLHALAPR
jgi:tetratricopeptide (TPR) repeat protein